MRRWAARESARGEEFEFSGDSRTRSYRSRDGEGQRTTARGCAGGGRGGVAAFFRTKVGPQDCMTPHDTFFSVNPYFLSFPGFWLDVERVAFSFVFHL